MRKYAPPLATLIFALFYMTGPAEGQVVVPPLDLNPLNQIAVPEPPNLFQYVTNKQVAIQLGKAFFWDMQAGSDGIQACATCHFEAGADSRVVNTVNPGTRAGDTTFQVVGPGGTLQPADFPFHQRGGTGHFPTDPVLRDSNDVVGSQGVHRADFVDIVPGSAVEIVTPVPDSIFNVDGINVRQVTARNTPTVVNAVFNFNQFWDGRAEYIFNGENPFGPADPEAGLWVSDHDDPIKPLEKVPVRLYFASLASQATGPILDDIEMSARGRTLPQVGRKLFNLTPLGKQLVSHDDSVLGGLARSATQPGARGLHTGYAELIQQSFHDHLWGSDQFVTLTLPNGQDAQFSQMEANFGFFWGVSIQLYLATLVSDQTPFDHWLGGDATALTEEQKRGFALFNGIAKCAICHVGIEFTTASHETALFLDEDVNGLIDLMFVADGNQAIYDTGFNNTAVTPTLDDLARGGVAPFINPLTGEYYPLSFTARAELRAQNLMPFRSILLTPGIPANMLLNVNGTFKVPTLRNIELTGPYFHNGSVMSLDDMLDFYIRGGNFPLTNINDLDPDIGAGIPLMREDETMEHAIVAFLKALTDWRVDTWTSPFDHPELFVPNGLAPDGSEIFLRVAATDSTGNVMAAVVSVNEPVVQSHVTTQIISGTVEPGIVIAGVLVDTGAFVDAVTVAGTTWSAVLNGLAEGKNTVTVKAMDDFGIEIITTKIIHVDTVPPELTLDPVATPTDLNVQTLTGSREANAVVRVSVNNGPATAATGSGTSWSFNASLAAGENTITVDAVDAAGNVTQLAAQTITVGGGGNPPPEAPVQAAVGGGGGGGCFIETISFGLPWKK